jgi:hypothetical protein
MRASIDSRGEQSNEINTTSKDEVEMKRSNAWNAGVKLVWWDGRVT